MYQVRNKIKKQNKNKNDQNKTQPNIKRKMSRANITKQIKTKHHTEPNENRGKRNETKQKRHDKDEDNDQRR